MKSNQLYKLAAFVNSIQNALQINSLESGSFKTSLYKYDLDESSAPEVEEIIPLTSVNNAQQLMLKKDSEKFNNADMGRIFLFN